MNRSEIPPAVPLWINGHAYLSMVPSFRDVRDRLSGAVVRRTPLCGPDEVNAAVASARAARPDWSARVPGERHALLGSLGDALHCMREHFSGLMCEETGVDIRTAIDQVGMLADALRMATPMTGGTAIVGVSGCLEDPLGCLVPHALPAVLSGSVLVLRTCPEAPSVLLAFAELSSRVGVSPGVINVLHGEQALDSLLRSSGVEFVGDRGRSWPL